MTKPAPRRALRIALVAAAVFGIAALAGCALFTQPVREVPMRGPKLVADAERLKADVLAIAKPRDIDNTESLDATAAFISERLRTLGYTPVEQPYEVKGRTYRNVSVLLGDAKAPRVVVGAHYDSCEAKPAADDNASGVSVVLELARLMKDRAPLGAVELVFWTLEEPPMFRKPQMGSAVHADSLSKAGVVVTAALAIETVGYYRDEPGSQHFPMPGLSQLYSDRGNYVGLVTDMKNTELARTLKQAMRSTGGIPVYSINAPTFIPGIDWSDHLNYWRHGYPALMVTDTAPNRNPNYHELTDTPDTLSYPHMARLTEALFEGIWVLAAKAR